MRTLEARAQEIAARALALVRAEESAPGLAAPNAIALELAAVIAELHAALRGPDAGDPRTAAEHGALVTELTTLQSGVRAHVIGLRFQTLERIHSGLARLRALPSVAELLPAAVEELAACCDFDRTLISRVRGGFWRAEAVWVRPDHDAAIAREIEAYVTGNWIELGAGVLETELVRRKQPALVAVGDDRSDSDLMAVARSRAYVAAPIMPAGRVIGFLQADCYDSGRELTTVDRDNILSFAEGFGLVFERTALLERLERQRARVHEAFSRAEHHLTGLNDAETMLVRREREPVAVLRTAAGLRKAAASPLEQLLTVREREVVELMVTGARNSQIGDQLVIAEETVKTHVRAISRKLRASSRADAVSRYLRLVMREQELDVPEPELAPSHEAAPR